MPPLSSPPRPVPSFPPQPAVAVVAAFAVAVLLTAALARPAGTAHAEEFQFSQLPGFAAIRAARGAVPPDAAARELLRRFRPVLFIAPGEEGPLDFYRDYIARGELQSGDGAAVMRNPSREQLNQFRHDPGAVFTHHPPRPNAAPAAPVHPTRPVAYGGVRRAALTLAGGETRPVVFLAYHFVFRHSGLPAGMPSPLAALANLVGDARDWHQLDHYTAAFVALNESGAPFAVLLQHHNYLRTYLVGQDPAFPPDAPPMLDAAVSSNELYPHRAEKTVWPAAGFLGPKTADYLAGVRADPPFLRAAPDVTDGKIRVEYELEFLPPNDAFYVFEGKLGEPRKLPGRDGPPGAIYNTLPALHPPETALPAFYWKPPDPAFARIIREDNPPDRRAGPTPAALEKLRARFAEALRKTENGGQ